MANRPVTRSAGVPVTSEENPRGHVRSTKDGDDAPSVTTSRQTRRSTQSTAKASNLRLKSASRLAAAEDKLDRVERSLVIAEAELEAHQNEIAVSRELLLAYASDTEDYKQQFAWLKSLEKEEKEFLKSINLLKLDKTLALKKLEREKKLSDLTNTHAKNLENIGSDDSQDLSGEEDADKQFEDDISTNSENSDDKLLRKLIQLKKGSKGSPPATIVSVEPKKPEVTAESTAVEQLAQALTSALVKANNNTPNNNSTGDKMLARQAMKMELSPFDGNSAEWPIFIQQYRTVAKACGLSSVENLHRLQRSLKGEARSSVSALLMAPENVEEILSVLEERFGNPRLVVQRLVEQAQALSNVKEGDHVGFLHYVDVVRNLATTAEAMKCLPFLASPQLITQLVKKLPPSMQLKWAEHQEFLINPFPDLTDVAAWLKTVSRSIMRIYEPCSSSSTAKLNPATKTVKPQKSFAATEVEKKRTDRKCRYCDADHHHLSKCKKFCDMEVEERWRWVRNNRYCFSCLNFGHGVGDCRGKKNCGVDGCAKPHHKLLHPVERSSATVVLAASEDVATIGHTVVSGHVNLNILPVQLKGPNGVIETYAMLDPGATLSVLDARIAEELGLSGPTTPLTHSGLHAATTVADSKIVEVSLSGRGNESFRLKNVRTVPQLSLPRQSVKKSTLNKWSHLKKLPITLYENCQPTILIGQDNVHLCNTSELVLGPANAPAAGKTKLGWVLMGRVGAAQEQLVSYHFREDTEDDLHEMVKYHFSTEAFGVKPNVERPRSRDDARAKEIMDNSLKRVGGRWECGLLWKTDSPELPKGSKEAALRRLYAMERKMDSSPEFAEDYSGKMDAYVKKGYARKLSPEEASIVTSKTYYLSHFLATNPKKKNKRRLVFDAKAKTDGKSLNDCLLAGPDQLRPISAILFRLREKAIAITADVRDMFHRVAVKEEDAVAQRFLWRRMDRSKPPDIYQMDVLIFGATCSPAIAQEAKNKNAQLFSSQYPETSVAIVETFYVDDEADSLDTVQEALERFAEMREVMSYGNFELVSWLSNSKEFMDSIPENLRAPKFANVEFGDESAMERVLGLFWKPVEDIFTFSLSFIRMKEEMMEGRRMPTKRELLALVMSLYDPLGLLSHFTVRGKMLLQDAWRTKIGWDDELQVTGKVKWDMWIAGLKRIPDFTVPRCYSEGFSRAINLTLHVFVDASEQAYGAVAYFVVDGKYGKEVSLVSSKARVAPLKPLSIPRMELQAAVLGARLAAFIKEEHTVVIKRNVFWSDSQTVLCWLNGDGRKFQQFVSHRIGEIQELTNPQEWRWIPTKLNVADEMTRDCDSCEWSPESRWITGPSFLYKDEDSWPKDKLESPHKEDLELKKEFVCAVTELPSKSPISIENYSSWTKLIRVTARVLQFVRRLRKQDSVHLLRPEDIKAAEVWWWKSVQAEFYAEELRCVEDGKKLAKTSQVSHLQLLLDEDGVLRLDGRLDKAGTDGYMKNPVLLHSKHPYTQLFISKLHEENGHHGQESVVNELRQKFYLPQMRAAVKRSWAHCQKCRNRRAQPSPPIMGQLPLHRLEVGVHPFTNTGLDYFGPMLVTIGRSQVKRWGALFTCLSTRAVHLEIAASLSTDSCIMAIRRFVGRRGCPQRIFSDNGTNFHGANNELKRALLELDQEKIVAVCAAKCIAWHFNPPSAPHMGGSWERLVRSVKVALMATLKTQVPKEEVLQTLMVEAEHSVNSHPLTHVSIDPEDPEALTPNHFLMGRSSNLAPPGIFGRNDLWSRKTWRKAQHLADLFWKRWLKEYLPTLQRRTKWMTRTKTVEVGDIALEADPQQPRNRWAKGIVTAVYPGEDKVVRVVDLKTATGTYRRPVAKLAILDVRREEEAAQEVTKDAAASSVSGRMFAAGNKSAVKPCEY